EVAREDAQGADTHRDLQRRLLKRPVAVAQEDQHVVVDGEEVGDRHVEFAVAIEIVDGGTGRRVRQAEDPGRVGRPVHRGQAERNPGPELAAGDEVGLAVAVEVAGDDPFTGGAGRKALFRLKGSVAAAQQDGNVVAVTVSGGQVQDTVAIEIRRHDLRGRG